MGSRWNWAASNLKSGAGKGVQFRQWREQDAVQVGSLLDADADAVWVSQFHALHGPAREGREWRRTLVAVDAVDRLIGCATLTESLLHGGRLPCAVDVAPRARRRGIGRALFEEMKALRPDGVLPLSTKVRQRDSAAMAFAAAVGGRVYQCSPRVAVDPRAPVVERWARSRPARHCRNLHDVSVGELGAAFAAVYEWIHRPWSPVTNKDVLAEVAATEAAHIDRAVSAGAWRAGRLAAVAFAFRSREGFEVVAETVRPNTPGGVDAVADVIALVIASAGQRGESLVAFDSHLSDPHLQPVLADLPHVRTDPLNLIEIS